MLSSAFDGKLAAGIGITDLFSQSVFGRLAVYEDGNDTGRLRRNPAMLWIVSDKGMAGSARAL